MKTPRRPYCLRPARPHERFPEYTAVLREIHPGTFVVVSFHSLSIPAGEQLRLKVRDRLHTNPHDLH